MITWMIYPILIPQYQSCNFKDRKTYNTFNRISKTNYFSKNFAHHFPTDFHFRPRIFIYISDKFRCNQNKNLVLFNITQFQKHRQLTQVSEQKTRRVYKIVAALRLAQQELPRCIHIGFDGQRKRRLWKGVLMETGGTRDSLVSILYRVVQCCQICELVSVE